MCISRPLAVTIKSGLDRVGEIFQILGGIPYNQISGVPVSLRVPKREPIILNHRHQQPLPRRIRVLAMSPPPAPTRARRYLDAPGPSLCTSHTVA